jgi:hypothetical protein
MKTDAKQLIPADTLEAMVQAIVPKHGRNKRRHELKAKALIAQALVKRKGAACQSLRGMAPSGAKAKRKPMAEPVHLASSAKCKYRPKGTAASEPVTVHMTDDEWSELLARMNAKVAKLITCDLDMPKA